MPKNVLWYVIQSTKQPNDYENDFSRVFKEVQEKQMEYTYTFCLAK